MQGQGQTQSLRDFGLSSEEEDNIAEGPEDYTVAETERRSSKEVRRRPQKPRQTLKPEAKSSKGALASNFIQPSCVHRKMSTGSFEKDSRATKAPEKPRSSEHGTEHPRSAPKETLKQPRRPRRRPRKKRSRELPRRSRSRKKKSRKLLRHLLWRPRRGAPQRSTQSTWRTWKRRRGTSKPKWPASFKGKRTLRG